MNSIPRKIVLLTLLLSACAHTPQASNDKPESMMMPVAAHPQTEDSPPEESSPAQLPHVSLDSKMLFEFLYGDIAAQRGRPDLAAQAYLDLAKKTHDPRVARRAAQFAFQARELPPALEAFGLWQELEPSAPIANQMLLSLLLSEGKFEEARPQAERLLKTSPKGPGNAFMLIQSLLIQLPDKQAALDWLKALAQPYPQVAEAHWAVAQLAAMALQQELALKEIAQAVQLSPDWDMAVLSQAQLLHADQPGQALEILRQFVHAHPDNKSVRLYYARTLLQQKHYAESRSEFQQLLKDNPENSELAFAVAMLSLQMGELDRAEKELQDTLTRGKKDAATVHYYLGQLNEARQSYEPALEQYRQVMDGEFVYAARLREAYLLNKMGKLEQVRKVLQNTPTSNEQQQIALVLIEAQMLRDARQFQESYKVLDEALKVLPDRPQLLFDKAIAADKLGKTEIFEQSLRKVLQLAPNHAQAYNALGYSYLERNVNIKEGMELVTKAYQLEPGDAAITDSMGWGYYRLGEFDKSVEFLRRAFAANPDPEIAAHLGEALWAQGKKTDANKIWQDAMKANPDNTELRAVYKKFNP